MSKKEILGAVILIAAFLFLFKSCTDQVIKSLEELSKQSETKKSQFMESCLKDHKQYECDALYSKI